ncbi:MAG: inositol monophosphatase [Anaerolineales bacterium]|nr:inositol monophosphatase [Anaerolineales bacterium]
MSPSLLDLETLARSAGEILRNGFEPRPGYGHRIDIEHKGEIDLVTEIDRQSEQYIIGEIKRRFPNHGIYAEESGNNSDGQHSIWYIDPLDGTINYAHGVPIFSVSIAYTENGELLLAVVYDPMQDECFTAQKGQAAWMNGKPIHVSSQNKLLDSLLVTGFPYDVRTNPDNNFDNHARLMKSTQGVRRLGSAALDLAYVASGRFDGFWELQIEPYDIAAGALIAREAGAVVTGALGLPLKMGKAMSILAANPQLHPQILAVINDK